MCNQNKNQEQKKENIWTKKHHFPYWVNPFEWKNIYRGILFAVLHWVLYTIIYSLSQGGDSVLLFLIIVIIDLPIRILIEILWLMNVNLSPLIEDAFFYGGLGTLMWFIIGGGYIPVIFKYFYKKGRTADEK